MEAKNNEHISLGGNIELNGFQIIERSKLVVLKKIIGNHARQIQNKKGNYTKLSITLQGTEQSLNIKAELDLENNKILSESNKPNIFMAIDDALKKIIEKL
ncbi:MAG: hypothetical protein KKC75_05675 [Nanoarchaeota archaeon]|nr:hypothetical protein [Nanoarchaeota archaeon]MBU1004935.1 hypothetical protein [Nanoarchaeota archaeon]MBU1945619.1 hypothetical protein [Nanoarchaeota archaeon]